MKFSLQPTLETQRGMARYEKRQSGIPLKEMTINTLRSVAQTTDKDSAYNF